MGSLASAEQKADVLRKIAALSGETVSLTGDPEKVDLIAAGPEGAFLAPTLLSLRRSRRGGQRP